MAIDYQFKAEVTKFAQLMAKQAHWILKKNVLKLVYQAYIPVMYKRTYQLLEAVTMSNVKVLTYSENNATTMNFQVYFDESKMHHYSLISPGRYINVAYFTDYGHNNPKGSIIPGRPLKMFDIYPARNFIEASMKEIHLYLQSKLTVFSRRDMYLTRTGDWMYKRR